MGNSFTKKVRCSVCDEWVERVGFLAQGGHWIGSQKCWKCRYAWTARGDTEEDVSSSLRYGGDEGQERELEDGEVINWCPRACGEVLRGVVIGFIAPGYSADAVLAEALSQTGEDPRRWQRRFHSRKRPGNVSHHRRYLVKVDRERDNGSAPVVELKPWYYAPMASTLEMIKTLGEIPARKGKEDE